MAELVAALKNAGILNCSLFQRGTVMIAYTECEPTCRQRRRRKKDGGKRTAERIHPVVDDSQSRRDGQFFPEDEIGHLD